MRMFAIFQSMGPLEILIVLGIVVLVFGASRLPKIGRSAGQGLRGFKDGLQEGIKEPPEELDKDSDESTPKELPKAPEPPSEADDKS
jgi:TatA/E family protein of Tat protein translocase